MSEISRDDVIAVFGQLNDSTVALIVATGSTNEELLAARDWAMKDAAHQISDRSLPPGPMASVVDIIERVQWTKHHPVEKSPFGNAGSNLT